MKYDSIKGYVDIDNNNMDKLSKKIDVIRSILNPYYQNAADHVNLVAGCADGSEAVILGKLYECKTVGIDISLPKEKHIDTEDLTLMAGDLSALSYKDETFDMIYSYHVLEHVDDHIQVLNELERVLKVGACMFIGFPNKNRMIGYIGAHNDVSTKDKIIWNLLDYKMRLKGRFENRYGAHAGFSQKEFIRDAETIFRKVVPVRNEYMRLKYTNHRKAIDALIRFGFDEFIFPSNYYICIK